MEIKKTSDINLNGCIKVIVYGESGTGKTRLCSTVNGNALILSAESGLLSLKDYSLDFIEIEKMEDLIEAYRFIVNSDESNKYDWICIDSISEVGEVCLSYEMNKNKDGRKAYGEMKDRMMKMFRNFRNISDKNIYMSAKIDRKMDAATGCLVNGPMMPGKQLGVQLPYLFDEIFQLKMSKNENEEIVRYLLTSGDDNNVAKDRSGLLDIHEKADLSYIFNKIIGEKND